MSYKDLAERTIASGIQGCLAALGTNSVRDMGVDQWKLIAMGGVTAGLAVIKGWVASVLPIGDKSPSFVK